MDQRFEVSAYFTGGFWSPDEITSRWNEPSLASFQFGSHCGDGYLEMLSDVQPTDNSLGAHVESLLGMLEPRKDLVQQLMEISVEAGISCSCYFHDTCPSFHLQHDLLRRCADLRLSLKFELFCVNPDEEFMHCFSSSDEKQTFDSKSIEEILNEEEKIDF